MALKIKTSSTVDAVNDSRPHNGVTNSPIKGSDFIILDKPKLQANVLVFGDGGNGKSTFSLQHAPHPVAFINFDKRAYYAVQKAMHDKRRIYFTGIDIPANVTKLTEDQAKKLASEAVKKVIHNFELAVRESQKGNVRTISLDTGTEYTEILRVAITGKMDVVKGDYGKSKDLINREWWRLFNLAREGNAHFIVLSRARAIWEDNQPTGEFSYRGPEVMNDAADWAAQIRLSRGGVTATIKGAKKSAMKAGKKKFELKITKAGNNIEELGAVYTSDDWGDDGPFQYACSMQFPNTDVDDWG